MYPQFIAGYHKTFKGPRPGVHYS